MTDREVGMSKIMKFLLLAAGVVWLGYSYQNFNYVVYLDFWTLLLPVSYLVSLVLLLSTK